MGIAAHFLVRRLGYWLAVAGAYSYHWRGRTDARLRRAAAAIANRMSKRVWQIIAAVEMILHVRLDHTCGLISVMAFYAPTKEILLEVNL